MRSFRKTMRNVARMPSIRSTHLLWMVWGLFQVIIIMDDACKREITDVLAQETLIYVVTSKQIQGVG